MIICINCSTDSKTKMDRLLQNSHYRDYSELVATAIDNLWVMEQEIAAKGELVMNDFSETYLTSTRSNDRPYLYASGSAARKPVIKTKPKKNLATPAISVPVRIPEIFLVDGLENLSVKTTSIPVNEQEKETFTLDRWLFGQYNKLLPLKANCRALLRVAAENPKGVRLEEIAGQLSEAASILGDYLANHDSRYQITRDDALATAFPHSSPDAEKSRARYANQFVGSVNSQGILSGLLCNYRLVALAPGMNAYLMLTDPAIQFARLENPVLDGRQTDPAQKFSPEEAAFLLDHIRAHVLVEAFAFRTLIQAIAEGAITPDKLDEALRVHVPAETNRSLSPSFLTSQRSGALSRMADLGLIARERKGVRVSYTITPEGEAFAQGGKLYNEKENA